MTGRSLLETRDLRVTFGDLVAIDGLDLTVARGEIVALIGPNGCGKSTLLRVLGGLLPASGGSVAFDGTPVTAPDARLGLVFQEPRLLPWRSVERNIAWPLELAGWPRSDIRERVETLAGIVGVGAVRELRPSQLSGGLRQRTAIARALALGPEVLLLDEPFSALDALTRERFNEELLALHESTAATMVLVTHSVPEAIYLADRVVVLTPRPGRVAAEVPIDAPRPRSLATLDSALVSDAAAEIRRHLVLGEAAA
jgi:NitT/TauT family transport system ATP-binding protein